MVGRVRVTVIEGPHTGLELVFEDAGRVVVGRGPRCDICLSKDPSASREHLRFEIEPPHVRAVDLASTHGTYVNDKKVTNQRSPDFAQVGLVDSDRVRAGSTLMVIRIEGFPAVEEPAPRESEDETAAAVKLLETMVRDQLPAPPVKLRAARDIPLPADKREFRTEREVPLEWQPGDVLLDLYEVVAKLGEGGMGTVWKVHHRQWDLDLAVKSPKAGVFKSDEQRNDFVREASTWVELPLHPHVASCHYVRMLGDAPRVFAEYVSGGSLAEWIKSHRLYDGGPQQALARILDLATQLAWGLQHAHDSNIVHQDVKPANVLMDTDGTAKVTDFGIARGLARPEADAQPPATTGTSLVVPSAGVCTVEYASPEQLGGGPLTRASDIWSWGVAVLEMFQGECTWRAGVAAPHVLEEYLRASRPLDHLPHMPDIVASLLQMCFEMDPKRRPHTMGKVAGVLRDIFEQETGKPYERPDPKPADLLAAGLNNRALSLLDLDRKREAESLFEQGTELDRLHPILTYNRGLHYWRSGKRLDTSIVARLREAVAAHGHSPEAHVLLAWIHAERGDAVAAQREVARADKYGSMSSATGALGEQAKKAARMGHVRTQILSASSGSVHRAAMDREGLFGISCGLNQVVRVWDFSAGTSTSAIDHPQSPVGAIAIGESGKIGLTGGDDGRVETWDLAEPKRLDAGFWHESPVVSLALSGDERWAGAGGEDGTITLWDLQTRSRSNLLVGHTGGVTGLSLDHHGAVAVSSSWDETVRVWPQGKAPLLLEGHEGPVLDVAMDYRGSVAVSAGRDGKLCVWDVAAGQCRRTLEGHNGKVISVNVSADGSVAFSLGQDGSMRIWDLDTGRCRCTLTSFEARPLHLATASNGRWALVSAGETLELWMLGRPSLAPFVIAKPPSSGELERGRKQLRDLLAKIREALDRCAWSEGLEAIAEARRIRGYERNSELLKLRARASQHAVRGKLRAASTVTTLKFPAQRPAPHLEPVRVTAYANPGLDPDNGHPSRPIPVLHVPVAISPGPAIPDVPDLRGVLLAPPGGGNSREHEPPQVPAVFPTAADEFPGSPPGVPRPRALFDGSPSAVPSRALTSAPGSGRRHPIAFDETGRLVAD